jgi:hypothetical protein
MASSAMSSSTLTRTSRSAIIPPSPSMSIHVDSSIGGGLHSSAPSGGSILGGHSHGGGSHSNTMSSSSNPGHHHHYSGDAASLLAAAATGVNIVPASSQWSSHSSVGALPVLVVGNKLDGAREATAFECMKDFGLDSVFVVIPYHTNMHCFVYDRI